MHAPFCSLPSDELADCPPSHSPCQESPWTLLPQRALSGLGGTRPSDKETTEQDSDPCCPGKKGQDGVGGCQAGPRGGLHRGSPGLLGGVRGTPRVGGCWAPLPCSWSPRSDLQAWVALHPFQHEHINGQPPDAFGWQAQSLKETGEERGRASGGPRHTGIHAAGHSPPHAHRGCTLHRPGSEAACL